MDEYLLNTATKLKTNNYNNLTIIIGNESCDLDSVASSLVYACFLNWQYQQMRCKMCTGANRPENMKEDIFVPILNVDREDYALKTEVNFLLTVYNIDEHILVFRDDYNLTELTANPKVLVVLVDHHVLAAKDQFLAPRVVEIVDHRPLDKSQWNYKEDTRSTIEITGSCCTLIAQRVKDLGNLIAEDVAFYYAYPVCCKLLHATIILDTVNFSKEASKATPHDEEIILFLESIIKPHDYNTERQIILQSLVTARSDVSSLTAAQLLRKDVKIIADTLVPSFPILVKEFLRKPEAIESVVDAMHKQNCSKALLLGMDLSQGLQRDVAVYCAVTEDNDGEEVAASFSKHLEQWTHPALGLLPEKINNVEGFIYYHQTNLAASRKQYMPAIAAFTKK